jgi:hypothetical protein
MATIYSSGVELNRVAPPRLPAAPVEYDRQFIEQYSNILRLYFNQLTNIFSQLNRAPYGAFSSNLDQTTTANVDTLMTLNTTDFADGVSINTSKITVAAAGIYNLQFSVQLENAHNAPEDVFIWLKQNGFDIPGSTGKVGMPARKGTGDPFHAIYGWNYFLSMAANDYVEIYWSTTNAGVTIQFYPASGSPTKPSTQSVVATMSFVASVPLP